jgi:hypothetical protein
MSGGGKTKVETEQRPAQLLPEAREGFISAQDFYKGILGATPVYTGPRVAPVSPLQTEAISQAGTSFGTPSVAQTAAEGQIAATAGGDYLSSPGAQEAIAALASPIFRRFQMETMPGIRDRATFAGHGPADPRRQIAEQEATADFAESLGRGAFAPIYMSERDLALRAAGLAPATQTAEALRLSQLMGAGAAERAFGQEFIEAARQLFEEPITRQSEAAAALMGAGAGTISPGDSLQVGKQRLSTLQEIQQWMDLITSVAGTAAMVAA